MAKKKNIILKGIEAFVTKHGGTYKDFYIGITKHVDQRLVEINIDEHAQAGNYVKGHAYYSAEAESRDVANEIEIEFQEKGMKGEGPSKGRKSSKYVYCFKLVKTSQYLLTEKEFTQVFKNVKKRLKDFKSFEVK